MSTYFSAANKELFPMIRHLIAMKRDFIALIRNFVAPKSDFIWYEVNLQSDEALLHGYFLRTSRQQALINSLGYLERGSSLLSNIRFSGS